MNASTTMRSPGVLLAALLCLGFPLLVDAWLPRHEGEPVAVSLSAARGLRNAPLPKQRIQAKQVLSRTDGERARVEYEFAWKEPGRYTLYGISSFSEAFPLALELNDETLSAMAFFRRSASRRDFERHRIAAGAKLRAGTNRLALEGQSAHGRIAAVLLRRELPLGPLRFLMLAACAAVPLVVRAALVRRRRITPGRRLAITLVTTGLALAAPVVAAAVHDGRAIADLDQADRRKRARLAEFEQYLASPEHGQARAQGFSVCVLGDSTHFWPRPRDERMLPTLRAALPPGHPIEVYGISAGAFSAYDYYLLMNRLVDEAPDLVVVPVNLRSFSTWWSRIREHDLPRIERYLRLDELPHAHGLEVGDRQIRWDALALVHLDGLLFDGDAGALLRGGARYLHAERDRVLGSLGEQLGWRPPEMLRRQQRRFGWNVDDSSEWPERVRRDHPMLEPYRLLNRLATEHRMPVLYYSVQANEQAQAKLGVRLDLRHNYQVIAQEIGRDPIVTFLDLSNENPPWMFADDSDHLSREGMQHVAKRLARAIVSRSRKPALGESR